MITPIKEAVKSMTQMGFEANQASNALRQLLWYSLTEGKVILKDNTVVSISYKDYIEFENLFGNPRKYTYEEFQDKLMVLRI